MFVIQRSDGAYATSGGEHSYTRDLTKAKTFRFKETAERERCGNESIVPVESLLLIPAEGY